MSNESPAHRERTARELPRFYDVDIMKMADRSALIAPNHGWEAIVINIPSP